MRLAKWLIGAGVVVSSADWCFKRALEDRSPCGEVPEHLRGSLDVTKLPSRETNLQRLRDQSTSYDLVVIGGGASGSGVALDAASRGLSTVLIERDDFASGTSGASSKLLHGGIRYLEKAFWHLDYKQFSMVVEALRERATLLKNSPHLAVPLPIVLPLHAWWQLPYYYIGAKCYDYLAGRQALHPSTLVSKSRALDIFPMLDKSDLKGAIIYYDGLHDDSRMNLSLAITASAAGATVVNHVEVVSLIKDQETGKLAGVMVRDRLKTNKSTNNKTTTATTAGQTEQDDENPAWPIYARAVINATGPFCDSIRLMDDPQAEQMVQGSSGIHVTLPEYYSPRHYGLLDPCTSDGRVIFFLPWRGSTIAGTTDRPCAPIEDVTPSEEEIAFILREIEGYLSPEVKIRRQDVLSSWAGIRPLVRDPDNMEDTQALARNHVVLRSSSGLISLAGGKWTTYRQMAEDAVDTAIEMHGLKPERLCCTRKLKLVGGANYTPLLYIDLIQSFNIATETARHLATAYGDQARYVLALAEKTGQRWPKIGLPLDQWYPYTEAEVRFAIRYEMARTADDILLRRTRLATLNVHAAKACLQRVVDILAEELGWDDDQKRSEYKSTLARIKRRSMTHEEQADDELAVEDLARSGGGI